MSEFSFIEYLKKQARRSSQIYIGIGDDAAAVRVSGGKELVISTDAIVDGVDFEIKKLCPRKIGRKALAVNLSDIAAMGARPFAFLVTIGKPKNISENWLKKFYDGLFKLAREYKAELIGGDFTKADRFFASIVVLGEADKKNLIRRSGAKAGDSMFVTGKLGGSILRHHCDFSPRVAEGLFLSATKKITSMIDVSDGLIQDLGHILDESKVSAAIDLEKIPISDDAKTLNSFNYNKALKGALVDGEDFELLFTVPLIYAGYLQKKWKKKFPKTSLTCIGQIISKRKEKIIFQKKDGVIKIPKLSKTGFSHF